MIRNGQLLPLVVATQKRAPLLPDVPTAAEVLPAWSRDDSQGLLAPAATPRTVVLQLNQAVARILDMPDVRDTLLGIDFNILTGMPEDYEKSLHTDIATFTRIAKATGLQVK